MAKLKARLSHAVLLVLFISAGCGLSPEDSDQKLKLTYIANEGFLIQANDKSILIDAIFGEEGLGFCDIPDPEVLRAMIVAEGDFEDIDIIAATHRHADHYHAPLVAAHLSNNTHGKFVSCAQAVDFLASEEGYDEFSERVIEITPDSLYYKDTVINEIGVRVYRLAHGPYMVEDPETGKSVNRHRNIQNLGFLFNLEGVKVFHCGDSSPRCMDDYEHFRLEQEDIDIALLGRGFLASTNGFGIDIIRNLIQPGHIVLMHIHHDQNPYFMNVASQVKEEFPSITIFESLMASKEFSIP